MIQAPPDNEALFVNTFLLLETFELDVWERVRNAVHSGFLKGEVLSPYRHTV